QLTASATQSLPRLDRCGRHPQQPNLTRPGKPSQGNGGTAARLFAPPARACNACAGGAGAVESDGTIYGLGFSSFLPSGFFSSFGLSSGFFSSLGLSLGLSSGFFSSLGLSFGLSSLGLSLGLSSFGFS